MKNLLNPSNKIKQEKALKPSHLVQRFLGDLKNLRLLYMKTIKEANKNNPCPHCGKPDWCYFFENGASVCNRGSIALGWIDSGKTDKNESAILYPEEWAGKPPKPTVVYTQEWIYHDRQNQPLVKVIRQDLDNGKKKIFQNYLIEGKVFRTRPKSVSREDIPIYRLSEVQKALEANEIIYIVEGEKCADLLCSLGLAATTNIQGCKSFSQSDVQDFGQNPRIVLVPDRDQPGIKLMEQWNRFFPEAQWLYPFPQKEWATVPPDNGVDIYDWITDYKLTVEKIREAIGIIPPSLGKVEVQTTTPLQIPNSYVSDPNPDQRAILNSRRPHLTRHYGEKNLNARELLDFVTAELGDRLKYDELRCEILLDDKLWDIGADIEFWFLRNYGESANANRIYNCLVNVAKQNSFNPVRDYLNHCRDVPRIPINDIAARHFGRPEAIYNRMVEMWLISAVARAIRPGEQVDHCLVLQSGQGKYKSTWFKTLFGDFFTDSVKKSNIDSPNAIMTIHAAWGAELAEIDSITTTKEAGIVKSFLTAREDYFRKPYLREIGRMKRPCVFCGTVNPSRFLVDDENRRFWPIPIPDELAELDIKLMQDERDGIWASALDAFESGKIWWPTDEEKKEIRLIMGEFEDIDVWADLIAHYIEGRPYVQILEILTNCLDFEEKDCDKRNERRVGKILTSLGWNRETRKMIDGKFARVKLPPKNNISDSSGNIRYHGKPPSESEFQDYRINNNLENNGNLSGSQTHQNHLPDKFSPTGSLPDNESPESHTQNGFYRDTVKNHINSANFFSEKNSEKNSSIAIAPNPTDSLYPPGQHPQELRDRRKKIFADLTAWRDTFEWSVEQMRAYANENLGIEDSRVTPSDKLEELLKLLEAKYYSEGNP